MPGAPAEQKQDGSFSRKAWITVARDIDNESAPSYLPPLATIGFMMQVCGGVEDVFWVPF